MESTRKAHGHLAKAECVDLKITDLRKPGGLILELSRLSDYERSRIGDARSNLSAY